MSRERRNVKRPVSGNPSKGHAKRRTADVSRAAPLGRAARKRAESATKPHCQQTPCQRRAVPANSARSRQEPSRGQRRSACPRSGLSAHQRRANSRNAAQQARQEQGRRRNHSTPGSTGNPYTTATRERRIRANVNDRHSIGVRLNGTARASKPVSRVGKAARLASEPRHGRRFRDTSTIKVGNK